MKKGITVLAVILAVVLLFPIPLRLKDGGTVIYQAVLYSVSDVHSLTTAEEMEQGKQYHEGIIIKIFGFEIFNNVK